MPHVSFNLLLKTPPMYALSTNKDATLLLASNFHAVINLLKLATASNVNHDRAYSFSSYRGKRPSRMSLNASFPCRSSTSSSVRRRSRVHLAEPTDRVLRSRLSKVRYSLSVSRRVIMSTTSFFADLLTIV